MKLTTCLKSTKGTSITILVLVLSMILGLSAFAIDVGMMVLDKARLAATMDSGALAGAQELISGSTNVEAMVKDYISKNLGEVKNIKIITDSTDNTVEVSGSRNISSFFANMFSDNKGQLSALAKAKVEIIRSLKGTRPLAVIQQDFIYGKQYTLKEGAGDGTSGNYAAIAMGGTGSSVYKSNLLNGYEPAISVYELIETETGNMSGNTETGINHLIDSCTHNPPCTYDNYNRTCPRIIFLPVVNTLEVNGRKYVQVLGFATFFLEGVTNHGGNADVTGRFITYNAQGETASDINDYGTYGIRLVK